MSMRASTVVEALSVSGYVYFSNERTATVGASVIAGLMKCDHAKQI